MKIKSMSIALKLKIGFVAIVAILSGVIVFTFVELKQEKEMLDNIFLHSYIVSNTAKNIHSNIFESYTIVNALMGRDKQDINEINAKINKNDIIIQEDFKKIFQRYLGSQEDIRQVYLTYQQYIILLRKTINENNKNTRKLLFNKTEQQQKILYKKVENLIKFADNKINEFYSKAKVREKRMTYVIAMMIAIAILLSILISIAIIKNIVGRINSITDITEDIKTGNFTSLETKDKLIFTSKNDEIDVLFNSYVELVNQLLLPYKDFIVGKGSMVKKTEELRRLLQAFDKYIIASKIDNKGKIVYISTAFQDVSGYSSEELIGKPHNLIYHEDIQEELSSEPWKKIESGKSWAGEIKNKTKTGGYFWVNAHISADIDDEGNIKGYNFIKENITISKEYEKLLSTLEIRILDEVRKNEEKTSYMIQQSRLAQMGEMISMIAHQWRQPLASISAVTGTLTLDVMMDNYNKEFFQERLESINELSKYLSEIINDFRGFFKDDKKLEELSINRIITESMNIIGPTLTNKNIEVHIDIKDEVIVKSYINEIKQVVLNILKNAEDALLEKKIKDAKIWIKGYIKEANANIEIEDNAGGIPDMILGKIFDPYFSTKKKKDGTGLGLYMSKTIIEEHCCGKLTVENTKLGAKFTIEIPLENKEV